MRGATSRHFGAETKMSVVGDINKSSIIKEQTVDRNLNKQISVQYSILNSNVYNYEVYQISCSHSTISFPPHPLPLLENPACMACHAYVKWFVMQC